MTTAIIVAAGRGTRMGPGADKLFLKIANAPLVAHTWRRFDQCRAIDEIVLVIRDGLDPLFHEIAVECRFQKPFRLVPGGQERQDSVANGLDAVSRPTEIVLIQDGARPCTSPEIILKTIEAARRVGAAVAAQRVTDTIKESDGGTRIKQTIDRSRLWAVQTPQTFQTEILRKALHAVRQTGAHVTDDTAACELIGQPVELVENATPNPKVTSPMDLPLVELILSRMP